MDVHEIQSRLEEAGELMVAVSEIDEPVELHIHDTKFGEDTITLDLTDGAIEFEADAISAAWHHKHSTEDLGL